MATKPSVLPRNWATLANYDTGPFIGQPMKADPNVGVAASGHRPGAAFPTPAEYENFQQFHITNWLTTWLALGSSAGAANAHLVEANSTGRSALTGLTLDDAADETVLSVSGVNTAAPTAYFTSSAGGPVVQADIGASAAIAFSTSVGVGAGVGLDVSLFASPPGAKGVNVTCDATTLGPGIAVTTSNIAAGTCIVVTSIGPAPVIDVVQSGSQTGTGIRITGGGVCLDIDPSVVSSPSGTGAIIRSGTINGTSAIEALLKNNTGTALHAEVQGGAATSAAEAVRAVAIGSAAGVNSTSVDGIAIVATATNAGAAVITATNGVGAIISSNGTGASGDYAATFSGDATSPVKGIVMMTPQNADPSGGGVTGALGMSNSKGLTGGNFADGTWRSYWHSANGYACAYGCFNGYGAAGLTITGAAFQVVGTIVTASNGDMVKVAGATVLVRLSFTMRSNSAAETLISVRVRDTTAGAFTVWQRAGVGGGDTAGIYVPGNTATLFWVPGPTVEFDVVVPASGTRQYVVEMAAPTGVPLRVRDVTAVMFGSVA